MSNKRDDSPKDPAHGTNHRVPTRYRASNRVPDSLFDPRADDREARRDRRVPADSPDREAALVIRNA